MPGADAPGRSPPGSAASGAALKSLEEAPITPLVLGSCALALLDRSIPLAMRTDPRLLLRARLVQLVHLLGVFGFGCGLSVRALAAQQLVWVHLASMVLFAFGFGLLRLTERYAVSAVFALSLGLVGVIANSIEVGGLVFLLSWGAVLATGAVFLVGLRAGLALGVVTVIASFAISYAHSRGLFAPVPASMTRDPTLMTSTVMVTLQVIVVMVFSAFHQYENAVLIRQLETARAEAERSSRAKSVFLATMSHEIRTPMNGVLAASDLLRRSELPAEQLSLAELVHGSGAALLRILDDILDFSKIEAEKVQLEIAPFDLQVLAEEVTALLVPRARDKGVGLTLILGDGVPRGLAGDASRLRQVLLNLLSNAVKFTARGEVRLRLDALPDGGVRFAVEDTGRGLSAAEQARLFQPFVQVDASVRRTHGGTGLGLAISRHLVEAMGGRITIDSALGEGSTFQFVLHLAAAALPVERLAPARALRPDATAGRVVLVVDDNAINRRVAERMVRHLGLECLVADGGERALELLATSPIALVLMDREMPDVDGLETTRRIRSLGDARAAVPVIGLTAAAFQEDVADCLAAGMQEVLLKPVTVSALAGVIERRLGGAAPTVEAA